MLDGDLTCIKIHLPRLLLLAQVLSLLQQSLASKLLPRMVAALYLFNRQFRGFLLLVVLNNLMLGHERGLHYPAEGRLIGGQVCHL